MKVRIRMQDGSDYLISDMPDGDCLDLRAAFEDNTGTSTLTVTMDESAIVVLSRFHVLAMEFDDVA